MEAHIRQLGSPVPAEHIVGLAQVVAPRHGPGIDVGDVPLVKPPLGVFYRGGNGDSEKVFPLKQGFRRELPGVMHVVRPAQGTAV